MNEQYKNKKILITGASNGLGAVCFNEFSKLGSRIVISGRNIKNLNKLIKESDDPSYHLAIPSDLTRKNNVIKLVKQGLSFLDGIDIIIHALGGGYGLSDPLLNWDQIELLHKINIYASIEKK